MEYVTNTNHSSQYLWLYVDVCTCQSLVKPYFEGGIGAALFIEVSSFQGGWWVGYYCISYSNPIDMADTLLSRDYRYFIFDLDAPPQSVKVILSQLRNNRDIIRASLMKAGTP